ncbi:MAG: hypothetical protein FJ387_28050, partial [Verrucomicrobia bacterium]|nr:hypothetical protein [Verrucomicrobiota bacterium]
MSRDNEEAERERSDWELRTFELPWYQWPFFRGMISLLMPPIGVWLLWRNSVLPLRRKFLGTAGLLLYGLPYAVLVILALKLLGVVDIEWQGGQGPSLVREKTVPNFRALEDSRDVQRRTLPEERLGPPAPLVSYWTDFRGPNRDGVNRQTTPVLLTNWPAKGPRLRWRQPVGGGYASFVAAENRAFTIEQRRDREAVTAYDLDTGRELWALSYPALFTEWMGGDGPRATPTYHDGLVYSLGAQGDFCCIAAATGKELWRKSILKDNQSENLQYGMANSPIVVDEKVIVLTGQASDGNSIVAYHRLTGERLWSALDDKQAYTSPLLATLAGQRQLVIVAARRVLAVKPDRGELLWDYLWRVEYDNCIAMPLVVGPDRIFLSAGYGTGCVLLEVYPKDNALAVRELWRNRNMKNKFNSSVLFQDHIYGLDEGVLACVAVATGQRLWRDGRYGYGQLLRTADQLIILSGEGELVLVRANPRQLEELARTPALRGKSWNVPALAEG